MEPSAIFHWKIVNNLIIDFFLFGFRNEIISIEQADVKQKCENVV